MARLENQADITVPEFPADRISSYVHDDLLEEMLAGKGVHTSTSRPEKESSVLPSLSIIDHTRSPAADATQQILGAGDSLESAGAGSKGDGGVTKILATVDDEWEDKNLKGWGIRWT